MTPTNGLLIDPSDNVAVALADIPAGATVMFGADSIQAAEPIPFAHKIAIRPIAGNEAILKYGVPVAFATRAIPPGAWVHNHNAKSYFVAKKEARQP
jgi:hypothetical protein